MRSKLQGCMKPLVELIKTPSPNCADPRCCSVAERGIAAQASLNAVSERGAALAPFRSCLVLVDPVLFPLIAESIYIRSVKVVVCGLISTG